MIYNGRKPVWAEGVLLAQQHLQQFDLSHENAVAQRLSWCSGFHYGFSHLSFDYSALARGVLSVTRANFIFENGKMVCFDRNVDQPLELELPADTQDVVVYIAMPANESVSGIKGYQQDGQLCAYRTEYSSISDQHDVMRKREVLFSTPNLFLLTEDDSHHHFDSLAVARLKRSADGGFSIDDSFIPPLLNAHISNYLKNFLQKAFNVVSAKASHLMSQAQALEASDIQNLMILNVLLPKVVELKHLTEIDVVHPERIYLALSQITASLSALKLKNLHEQIPEYNHKDLGSVFSQIDETFTQLLSTTQAKVTSDMKLVKLSSAIYNVNNIDAQQFDKQDFYLGVYMESADNQWIDIFGSQVKIGSAAKLEFIVASALPGISIQHVQRTPHNLAIKSGFEYFRLEPYGDLWQNIVEEQNVGIFIPHGLQDIQLEFISIDKS
ncbi:type VI secretion system baseplate subunit TssK [Catenovulum sp. SM1970]|uniref:type VI secretion system baseplate subunit TssK n=1 Tax=Marinifaba aquimaris TaxID=2741323 RepID=UPI0015730563|nr:type VI secretion system baseplate subunit TssK [Marinifaba aquimaris]NTS77902.1 type VI secretion system baseplate subunit TssK [Marinifaba aquimaris]